MNSAVQVLPCCPPPPPILKPLVHTTLPKGPPLGFCILHSRKPYQTLVTFSMSHQCTQQLGTGTKVFASAQHPRACVWFYKAVILWCFPLDSRIEYLRHACGFEEERVLAIISNHTAFISWNKERKEETETSVIPAPSLRVQGRGGGEAGPQQ